MTVKRPTWQTALLVVLAAVGVTAAVAAIFLERTLWAVSIPVPAQLELLKFLLQLLSVVVIGGCVSLLLANHNRERARDDAAADEARQQARTNAEFKREIRKRFIEVYTETKKIRRLLRASTRTVTESGSEVGLLPREEYIAYAIELNELQLEIEVLRREIKADAALFANAETIRGHASKMEEYLRRIVREFELRLPVVPEAGCQIQDLPALKGFMDYSSTGTFDTLFAAHFPAILDALRAEIFKPASGESIGAPSVRPPRPTS